jgi:hypothetical protein
VSRESPEAQNQEFTEKGELKTMLQTHTVEGWSGVIADLSTKQAAAKDHLEQLRKQKQELSLEAALGSADAKKKLDKINSELGRLTLEADDFDSAIRQAETAKSQAATMEATRVEKVRQEKLSTLAATAVGHARDFTKALEEAVQAGAATKQTIKEMLKIASNQEAPALDRLLAPGIFMRGAEHAGLRSHLEFAAYNGERSHVVALEDALSGFLERWLKKE